MNARRSTAGLLAVVLGAVLSGCGVLPRVGNDTLHLVNGTTIPVQLAIDGRVIAFVNPGEVRDLGSADLGAMPWRVAVRTASDRQLLTLDVEPASVHDEPNLDGTGSYSAPATRVDLSCGTIRLYAGRILPGGPAPGPGVPGDCEP